MYDSNDEKWAAYDELRELLDIVKSHRDSQALQIAFGAMISYRDAELVQLFTETQTALDEIRSTRSELFDVIYGAA